MSLFSKQKTFCPACGKELNISYSSSYTLGQLAYQCSKECSQEIHWRSILSTLGKEYYPEPSRTNESINRSETV